MRALSAGCEWLSVFPLPAHAPDLNPVEWVRAHVERGPAGLAVLALDRLEALVRNRLERLRYRPGSPDGFTAGTGLSSRTPRHLDEPQPVNLKDALTVHEAHQPQEPQ
ncbi:MULTISPECIES: transposase [unclassified Streptomyces]|uniref:transposase n=1 Tax=unclassified Streptomyces TaxID=2593676 RepID=UPI001F049C51|nr:MULTISPECIES: transposase [unclassified Streptomyces]